MECRELENIVINCSKFSDTEAIIKKTEAKIRQISNSKEKQYYAQDILLEAKALLSCLNYDSKNLVCQKCNLVANGYIQEYKYLDNEEIKQDYYRRLSVEE